MANAARAGNGRGRGGARRGTLQGSSWLLALVVATAVGLPAIPGRAAAAPADVTALLEQAAADGETAAWASVGQVAVMHAPRGARAALIDASGTRVERTTVDGLGSALFREVPPASGYRVRVGRFRSDALRVRAADETPPPAFYRSQRLSPGFGYVTTRDGTRLSVDVSLPGPVDGGPYPTVVEYSGYDPSNPTATQPTAQAARLLGYAIVGVNLRGTGCSGGAFDYFEELQALDGYDVIETVAAQPWVAHGKVGMFGISYAGISQLFVAATRPPSLAAITPLSVVADTYSVLYPGGILNDGFASEWAEERTRDAAPAARRWVRERIRGGDEICRENQLLRLQSVNLRRQVREHRYYRPAVSDALAPRTFVRSISVPVFLAGAWQDEQTGAGWADLVDSFDPTLPNRFVMVNGLHADSLSPVVLMRAIEFLDFYVARRIPEVPTLVRLGAPLLFREVYGVGGITLPPDRFADASSFEAALAQYRAEPRYLVLFESGAGRPRTAPVPAFQVELGSWPPRNATATPFYLGAGGTLTSEEPSQARGADRYRDDPDAFQDTDAGPPPEGSQRPGASPEYRWQPAPAGRALTYETEALTTDTVVLGRGSVDLWLKSTARDVDVQVTLSEVRPDGQETFVQSGWLRASARKLDRSRSTELAPVPTYRRRDARRLPRGHAVLVRVPLQPVGHAFRSGSRIRLTVQPPGGDHPRWTFDALGDDERVVNTVARNARRPSRIVLPVVPSIEVPTRLPACGDLRGQPCRPAR